MHGLARSLVVAVLMQAATVADARGMPPSTLPEIVAGANACLAATGMKAVDAARLQRDGWHAATVSQSGKPVAASLRFFGKGSLLLSVDDEMKTPTCFITAHLPAAVTFDDVAGAIDQSLGVHGKSDGDEVGALYFFPPDHIVQLKSTGTPAAPSVRIAVGYRV